MTRSSYPASSQPGENSAWPGSRLSCGFLRGLDLAPGPGAPRFEAWKAGAAKAVGNRVINLGRLGIQRSPGISKKYAAPAAFPDIETHCALWEKSTKHSIALPPEGGTPYCFIRPISPC